MTTTPSRPQTRYNSPYYRRKRRGIADSKRYKIHKIKMENLATLFYGFAVGLGFMFLMGFAIGYREPIHIVFMIMLFASSAMSLSIGLHLGWVATWKGWTYTKRYR